MQSSLLRCCPGDLCDLGFARIVAVKGKARGQSPPALRLAPVNELTRKLKIGDGVSVGMTSAYRYPCETHSCSSYIRKNLPG